MKADLNINANKPGTLSILRTIITTANKIYRIAIKGTTAVATDAIQRTPPKIINAKITASAIPIIHPSTPKAFFIELAMALD